MRQVLDFDRWPLDALGEARGQALVARCRNELREAGMFSLTGLIRPEALCAWPLAMLGFSTAAWKLAPRDAFIGWTPQLREKNLPLVVDNPRFLILPWFKIPNLGSHILAIVRRRLPQDWTERYNTTPVLIEIFVETPRYTGAVYRASG